MLKRISIFTEFLAAFFHYVLHIREVILCLVILMMLAGCVISQVENLNLWDAFYFAFITGLSIGYGDITPQTAIGKVTSVGIGVIGILFVGITAAIATRALTDTAKRHNNP